MKAFSVLIHQPSAYECRYVVRGRLSANTHAALGKEVTSSKANVHSNHVKHDFLGGEFDIVPHEVAMDVVSIIGIPILREWFEHDATDA